MVRQFFIEGAEYTLLLKYVNKKSVFLLESTYKIIEKTVI